MDHLPNRYARSFDIYGVDECVKAVLVGWVPWNGSFGDSFLNLYGRGYSLPFEYFPDALLGYGEKVEQ